MEKLEDRILAFADIWTLSDPLDNYFLWTDFGPIRDLDKPYLVQSGERIWLELENSKKAEYCLGLNGNYLDMLRFGGGFQTHRVEYDGPQIDYHCFTGHPNAADSVGEILFEVLDTLPEGPGADGRFTRVFDIDILNTGFVHFYSNVKIHNDVWPEDVDESEEFTHHDVLYLSNGYNHDLALDSMMLDVNNDRQPATFEDVELAWVELIGEQD